MLVTAGANDLPVAQDWQAATGAPLVSAASVAWAAAVLLGRSYSLDVTEPELPLLGDLSSYGSWAAHAAPVTALVPWADMLRHSPDAGGWVRLEEGGRRLGGWVRLEKGGQGEGGHSHMPTCVSIGGGREGGIEESGVNGGIKVGGVTMPYVL